MIQPIPISAKLKLLRFASLNNLNSSPVHEHPTPNRSNTTLTHRSESHQIHHTNTNTTHNIQTSPISNLSNLDSPTSSSTTTTTTTTTLPNHHDPSGNGFRNPWPSASQNSSNSLINSILTRGIPLELARKPNPSSSIRPTNCLPAQFELYDGFTPHDWKTRQSTQLIFTWLGHAGCLVQLPTKLSTSQSQRPLRVLFDPIFSTRAGPSTFTGPKRLIGTPCRVIDLPTLDLCCISHSHYDHLDYETIKELIKFQPHVKFYVPLGLKAWFATTSLPTEQVIEMDWWDSQTFSSSSSAFENLSEISTKLNSHETARRSASELDRLPHQELEKLMVRINCVPAQHSSGRSLLDQNASLWCGWVIEQITQDECSSSSDQEDEKIKPNRINDRPMRSSVYFAGDTGYRNGADPNLCCPAFREIGEKFGPIDFSMIPIWRGGSLSFISWAGLRLADENLLATHHASPTDAIKIHQEVRSRHSIAVHHGCFVGSGQESIEALEELERARVESGVGDWNQEGGFGAIDVGVTIELNVLNPNVD